jgi:hypothetical protein
VSNRGGSAGAILLTTVGLLMVLYSVVFSLLFLIGERTVGEVTVVRRELGESRGPAPNRYLYSIGYEFRLPDGRSIGGTTKRISSAYDAGISKGTTTVWYLRGFPYINALDEDAHPSLVKALLACIGGFSLVISLRGLKSRKRMRTTRRESG